jgi:ribonucleoside-diphosphate reductase beta chain
MGIQRFDQVKYPEFKTMYEKMQSFMWRPSEINLSNDRTQYEALGEIERSVFDTNLKFQTMGDSMLSRSINVLQSHVSNTELEYCMSTWAFFENLHSESYTWILQNITSNPGEFFDAILEDKEIVKRAKIIKDSFDGLLGVEGADRSVKESIFKAVLSLQISEGLFFYNSFACSFWFGSKGVMRGNADIIKMISRDESIHCSVTQSILKRWKRDKSEGFQSVMSDNEDLVYAMWEEAVKQEKLWAEYLFRDGELIGLNAQILSEYTEWLANLRLGNLGLKKLYKKRDNPIRGWINEYTDSSKTSSMPQEQEITSYRKNSTNNSIDLKELKASL